MELDEQTLLQSLVKDSSVDTTKYLSYLQSLFTYDTERLHREIEYLNDEKSSKSSQMLSLTFENYSTFIRTAECSKDICDDFSLIEDRLALILTQSDQFSNCCQTFIRETEQTNHLRKQNMFTLQKYPQLLEILEIPQLMDTCVRNDYFDEALELVTYCKRLERKFSLPSVKFSANHFHIPLVVQIVQDVRLSLEYMLEQLIHQLQAAIQLPACLRIMGFIRRMDIYNELELRLCFLQARTHFLQKRLNLLHQQYSSSNMIDHYEHASKYIDETRNILFDIVTQYRALFTDDDTTLYVTFNRNEYVKETNLFRSWLISRLTEFLKVLQDDLQHCTGTQYQRLESLLGQLMYFGASFSRYGFDFRPLFIHFFTQTALNHFRHSLIDANHLFHQLLQSYAFDQQTHAITSADFSPNSINPFVPPMILVSFSPLAVYCNALLVAFNDLRLCCPLSIVNQVKQLLTDSLLAIRDLLFSHYQTEKLTLTPRESEHFLEFLRVFSSIFVPYLNSCLQALFPDTQLARELGLSVLDISEKAKLNRLHLDKIVEPIQTIIDAMLPKKIPPTSEEIITDPPANDTEEQTPISTDNEQQQEIHEQSDDIQ